MEELLPEELMIDILSRLPVKTIIHCKCVCKKWRNLVLDSSFVNLHLSRSPTGLIIHHEPPPTIGSNVSNNDEFLICPGILGWVEIEDKDDYHHLHHDPLMSLPLNLAPILQKSQINLIGSVNGLICLWQDHPNLDNTYICNLVTREYMILPRRKYYIKRKRTPTYGFGVSSMTGEYKVIRTLQSYKSQPSVSEAEVYTLGTGQWRSLGRVPYVFYGYYGPFLNNHCHWIVIDKEDSTKKVCTFDLDKETFQLFPSPPPTPVEHEAIAMQRNHQSLAILKGCLCKFDIYEFRYTIWVMKEYGIKESWHKELVINEALSGIPYWLFCVSPIEVLKDGSILMISRNKLRAFIPLSEMFEDTGLFEFSSRLMSGMAYRPSFLKLQNFELERVLMF